MSASPTHTPNLNPNPGPELGPGPGPGPGPSSDAGAGPGSEQVGLKASRSVDIMSDAAHWILTQPVAECSGNTFIDDEVHRKMYGSEDRYTDR